MTTNEQLYKHIMCHIDDVGGDHVSLSYCASILCDLTDKQKGELALAILESIDKPAHRTCAAKLDCAKNDLKAAIPNLFAYHL